MKRRVLMTFNRPKLQFKCFNDIIKEVFLEENNPIDPLIHPHWSPVLVIVCYIKLSFFNKNSNMGQRESKIENPTKRPNEPPIDPNIPTPS